jgi:hypothetical protein
MNLSNSVCYVLKSQPLAEQIPLTFKNLFLQDMMECSPTLINLPPNCSQLSLPICVINTAITNLDSVALSSFLQSPFFDSSLISSLTTDSIQQLLKVFRTGSTQTQTTSSLMIRLILEHLNNDVYTIEFITKCAVCSDFRIRLLAISMLPLVHDPTPLRNCFFSLTLDRVIPVRCAVLRQLRSSHFHTRIVEVLLRNAVGDVSPEVKTEAAKLIGDVAPHLISEFCGLLKNVQSGTAAFENLHKFVKIHGLSPLFEAVKIGAENVPNAAISELFKILPILSNSEQTMVWSLIDHIVNVGKSGIDKMNFVEYCDDPNHILKLLNPKNISNWRDRLTLIQRAMKILPNQTSNLSQLAVEFSGDDTAIVRNASVKFWIALIELNPIIVKEEIFESLLRKNWQTRLVVAKVIIEIGMKNELLPIAETLSRDPVESVRSCLASGLQNTDWFSKLFTDSQQLFHVY